MRANTSQQTSECFLCWQMHAYRIQKYIIAEGEKGKKKKLFTEQKLRVSTVLCFFATEVCAVDCGPHGSCIGGVCHCEEGWTGPECGQRDCHPRCIDHGVCREGKCDCHQGWTGEHCTIGEPQWHIQCCTPTQASQRGTNYRAKFIYWQA